MIKVKKNNEFKLTRYCLSKKLDESKILLLHTILGNILILDYKKYDNFINKKDSEKEIFNLLKDNGFIQNNNIFYNFNYLFLKISLYLKLKKLYNKFIDIVFIPTYDCNFNCYYCIQKSIKNLIKENNSINNQKNINLKKLFIYLNKKYKKKIINISIYGGEPLLISNKPFFKELINLIKDKHLLKYNSIQITTNGYNIDKFIKEIKYIDQFQITLEGPPEIHNKIRKHENKNNTYSKIIKNIKILMKLNKTIIIRINYSKFNINFINKLLILLEKENIIGYHKLKFSFSPIFNSKTYDCSNEELKYYVSFFKSEKKILKYYNNYLIQEFIYKFSYSVQKNLPFIFNPFSCSAFRNQLIFGPNFEIFSCHNMILFNKYKIGSFNKKIKVNIIKYYYFKLKRFILDLKCLNCEYFLICGKSCFLAKKNIKNYNNCNNKILVKFYFDIALERLFMGDEK